jgi:hypothetical protein
MPLFKSRRIPRELAERLRIAAALAREQVLEKHIASAIELLGQGADQVPVERLLNAYTRLHFIEYSEERQINERVLAALGQDNHGEWAQREITAPRAPWRRLARRVRGRVHHDLRRWLEGHTARVELELIDLHVRHALECVRITEGHFSTGQALEHYARELRLRAATAEMVRLLALRTLEGRKPAGQVERFRPGSAALPLRIADGS